MAHNKWSEEEKEYVRQNYMIMNDEELNKHIPNHSVDSIATWRRRNGCHYDNPFHKKYTFDNVREYMEKYGYDLLSEESDYQNAGSSIRYKCNIHSDVVQTTTMGHLLEGKKCRYCGIEATANKRRISLEVYIDKDKSRCQELGFEYIDTVRGENGSGEKKIFIEFICNRHRAAGTQRMARYNMYRDIKGCEYCAHKKFLDGELENLCKQGSPHITIITKPIFQINQRVDCVCEKHGNLAGVRIGNLIDGCGCAKCGLDKLAKQMLLTVDEVNAIVGMNHPNATIISEYQDSRTPLTLCCNKCGFTYKGYVHARKQCPNCERYYYGEKMIQIYLEGRNIDYIPQYKFVDCCNKRPLPFDFYLPEHNICIEYQGKQHYEAVDLFGGDEGFEYRRKNDEIKRKYCKENEINLIEIPYTCNTSSAIEVFLNNNI